jgi:putative DNA primase/helicase
MVVNLLTPEGAQPVGSGNGINRSNGQPVPREHVVVRLTGDAEPRIAKLDVPADVPAALHARLGYDERYKAEAAAPKDRPAVAPQAAPVTPPRPV